ncbi:MAG: hypothetical protein AB7N73_00460 [Gemmatimonadales bacterium]
MRCLGRVVALIMALLLLGAGWLYYPEISRYVRGVVDPMSLARRTGTPSVAQRDAAASKIANLVAERPDSVLLTAGELASLLVEGGNVLGVAGVDSVQVELGDRRIRVRALLDTERLPARYRQLIPGTPERHEEVIAEGELVPARPGTAEWQLDRVIVRGLPLPSDVVARVLGRVTGRESDGRLTIRLPAEVRGFRVRPEGVALYRSAEE